MGRRTRRYVSFILAIALGIAIGVIFGWAFNPLKTANTGFDSLRVDYKTDYILMVSQLYQSDEDLVAALDRLSNLGEDAPLDLMQNAINYATQHAYASADITLMEKLATDIAKLSPTSD